MFLGRDEFKGKNANPDTDVNHLSLRGKSYFGPGPNRPFLGAGIGVYDVDPGSTDLGANVGAGIQFNLTSKLAAEVGLKYHNVFNSGPNLDFLSLHAGLRIRF